MFHLSKERFTIGRELLCLYDETEKKTKKALELVKAISWSFYAHLRGYFNDKPTGAVKLVL